MANTLDSRVLSAYYKSGPEIRAWTPGLGPDRVRAWKGDNSEKNLYEGGNELSTSISGKECLVVHGTQDPSTTTQTRGMVRRPGIDSNTVGAKKIWLGHVTCAPNTLGPPHHHGEAETAAYVVSGQVRVYFGEDFKEYVDAGPGDFIFVPAHMPHIEGNVTDEPAEAILSRGPDNIVINLGE